MHLGPRVIPRTCGIEHPFGLFERSSSASRAIARFADLPLCLRDRAGLGTERRRSRQAETRAPNVCVRRHALRLGRFCARGLIDVGERFTARRRLAIRNAFVCDSCELAQHGVSAELFGEELAFELDAIGFGLRRLQQQHRAIVVLARDDCRRRFARALLGALGPREIVRCEQVQAIELGGGERWTSADRG
jgi:hypothetical protein